MACGSISMMTWQKYVPPTPKCVDNCPNNCGTRPNTLCQSVRSDPKYAGGCNGQFSHIFLADCQRTCKCELNEPGVEGCNC